MFFERSDIRDPRLYVSLGMGLLVMALMILTYVEIWRPRQQVESPEPGLRGLAKWFIYSIPWVATITFVGLFLFALIFSVYRAFNPPNW